jgi:hypothetical protein
MAAIKFFLDILWWTFIVSPVLGLIASLGSIAFLSGYSARGIYRNLEGIGKSCQWGKYEQ